MSLEIKGKLTHKLEPLTGEGKNGVWIKNSFVITTEGDYPKDASFDVWGDKGDILETMQLGQNIIVSFEPESREHNGKWYTNNKAWKIVSDGDLIQPTESVSDETANVADLPF